MADRSVGGTIAAFPPDIQAILEKIRAMIQEAVPAAREKISYKMPAFARDGDLIDLAAFKKPLGIVPPARGDQKLARELARYRGAKGNLKFPLDEPIPCRLIARVIKSSESRSTGKRCDPGERRTSQRTRNRDDSAMSADPDAASDSRRRRGFRGGGGWQVSTSLPGLGAGRSRAHRTSAAPGQNRG